MRRIRSVLGYLMAAAVAATAALVAAPPMPAGAADVREVIGHFETGSEGWALGLGNEFPGARGDFQFDTADAHEGEHSGLLSGDFSGGGNYVEVSRPVGLDITSLRFWTRSADLDRLVVRVFDSTGQAHQQQLPLAAGGAWQQLEVTRFDGGVGYSHFGGANDGVWHAPAQRVTFILDRGRLLGGRTNGTVRFDDVSVTTQASDLDLRPVQPGNVFVGSEPSRISVVTNGDALSWEAYDFAGSRVGGERTAVEPGETTLTLPIQQPGYYRLTVTAERDGAVLATRDTTFARLTPFDTAGLADSPFGMAAHISGTSNLGITALMAKAGVKNLREDAFWNSIEATKGSYGFQRYDALQSSVEDAGMQWLPIAAYTNPFYDNNATPYTDAGRAGFGDFAAATTKHFDGQVKWLEVYNEFNIPGFGDQGGGPADNRADYYFPLLKATYERVKAQTPDVTVAGAVTAGVPLDWLEELFKLGGLKYMDVVSVHPYVYPAVPELAAKSLADLQDLIKRYNGGKPKPIWISEQGWPTHTGGNGVSESTQASYIVRSHVVAFSQGVERYFWYDFMNDGLDPAYNENNFGIVRNTSDPAGAWTPKPAFVSYATMTRQLTGATFDHQEDLGSGVSSYVFTKDGEPDRVLWSTDPTVVTVRTDDPITVTDLTGVAKTYTPQAGQVHLSLSGDPIYVAGDVEVSVTGKLSLTAGNGGQAVLGEPVPLTLTIDTTKAPQAPVRGTFEIAGASVPVSVPAGTKAEIPVSVPAQSRTGPRDLVGDLVVRGRAMARLDVRVEVTHPFGLSATHVLKEGADVLTVAVTNHASQALSVEAVSWKIGDATGTIDLPEAVPGRSTRTADVPLGDIPKGQAYPLELRLSSPGLSEVVVRGKVSLPESADVRALAHKSITVDGVLDDMSGVPGIDLAAEGQVEMPGYGGTDDLSGTAWWTWDADNLYLSARIHDDTHAQPATGDQIWSGDGFQFTVTGGLPGESTTWYEYGVALTAQGPQAYRWLSAQGPAGPVTDVDLKVTRDDAADETVYELAMPWQKVAPFDPDHRLMSLSFLVNDNDGTGRKGWIEWGSGIGGSKDPELFRPVRLADAS
ncbi:sugar-binding protein [Actinopolymorpha pittospori]|uniref:Carbohydrate family 9 binding domain-like n=1 Tax=Actinopolymorpha pittospori TaxID=648752 RepID=A0A927MZ75_9ACTN|nr:sugar-binding protein [Actinopolymorpha pittospori]MBE1609680.1 hypothetical protein [Actinopolymorpha pittospori]